MEVLDKKAAAAHAEEARLLAEAKKNEAVLAAKKFDADQKSSSQRSLKIRRWVQTIYPAELAERMIEMFTTLMKPDVKKRSTHMWCLTFPEATSHAI